MKILCIAHYYPPHVGGLEIIAQKQAQSLAVHGHSVSVVTCATHPEQRSTIDAFGVNVHFVRALNFSDRYFGIPFPLPGVGMVRVLWQEIARADSVHLHDVFYMTSWCAYVFARIQHKPIILTQHVGIVEHSRAVIMFIQRIVYTLIGRMIFHNSRAIIVYNRNIKNFLAEQGTDMKKVLQERNGIDLSRFQPVSTAQKKELRKAFGLPTNRPLVLFVGRFVPKKGADVLFAARDPRYDLVFAGSGTVPRSWQIKGVHLLGPLNHDALVGLYQLADVFVLPARGEIFPLAVQEAMACGLPVITTDEPAYREYQIDRDLFSLVPPDPEALRSELARIIESPSMLKKMSAYSLGFATKWFNWGKNLEPLLNLYAHFEKPQGVLITTSWDDGHVLDLKLAELLRTYGIAGTFYIAPHDREITPGERLTDDHIRELSQDFEIGAHTMTHPRLTLVNEGQARHEIENSKKNLETVTHGPVTSFCYPQGYYSEHHKYMVRAAGFLLARTVARFAFSAGSDPYALPTTVHAYRHWSDALPIFKAVGIRRFLKCYLNWDELAIELFEKTLREGGVFHLWGHSWEVDQNGNWKRLERVLRHIGGNPRARYVTNAELL